MSGMLLLENWRRDLRYAVRSLVNDLRFTSVAVFALALGIGASTVVFSLFYNLLFNALMAKEPQRVVVPLIEDAENPNFSSGLFIGWADLIYLKAHNQVFDGVIRIPLGQSLGAAGATHVSVRGRNGDSGCVRFLRRARISGEGN